MTQMPPPPTMTYAPPQPRPTNGWAIASLVCGIIGCLVITPVLAVITGIIGLGKSRRQGGRGLAVTGIILGILWIIGFVGVGGAGYFGLKVLTKEAKQKTVDMVNALANDDFVTARQFADISDDDAAALSAKFKEYGTCKDVSLNSYSSNTTNGRKSIDLEGSLFFDKAGSKSFRASLSNDSGKLKIDSLRVD